MYLCAKISWYVVVDFIFSYKCRFASVSFCWKELILNISLDMEKLPLSAVSNMSFVPTSLRSAPMLCPIPCDAPLNDNSHGEACVCMSERERVLVVYGVCVRVCELGGEKQSSVHTGEGTVVRVCESWVVCRWTFKGRRPKLMWCTVILPEVFVKRNVRLFLINTIKYAVT